jgi:predicted Zn finger-like uncharacterized protein
MKRMETNSAGNIIVTEEKPIEIPDKPKEPEPPLADKCVVTDKFCDGGPGHPFSLFVNYRCPSCDQSYRIALDNIPGPGNKIVQCECGNKITLPLAFDKH